MSLWHFFVLLFLKCGVGYSSYEEDVSGFFLDDEDERVISFELFLFLGH
jgi:hypothetical protein